MVTGISRLNQEIKCIRENLTILDLFRFMRYLYLEKNISEKLRKVITIADIEYPTIEGIDEDTRRQFLKIIEKKQLDWGDWRFHRDYRITELDGLLESIPSLRERSEELRRVIYNEGGEKIFLLSLLPLNLLLPSEVKNKYIPQPDYWEEHPTKDPDSYGLFTEDAKIKNGKGQYLASKKFPHSALMNIETFCPMGCVGCYKSYYVRETGHRLEKPTTVEEQAKNFVKWLNEHPEVYDIIVSGGEPLMYENHILKNIFDEFKKAYHLKVIRICTGTLFMGLPFRIDNEILDILKNFSEETGMRITIQAHLANHYNITPEALIAIDKIKKRGFKIYSQIPIMEGINFFSDDLEKTKSFWKELGKRQLLCDIEPYKYIVDQHPRTLRYYVPIELLMHVWSEVWESHDLPELQRPRTLSILYKPGNVILSGHTLFAMKKKVDEGRCLVTYYIPKIFNKEGQEFFEYKEPLMEYNKDPKSLDRVKKEVLEKCASS